MRNRILRESSPAPLVYALQNRQARSRLVSLMSAKSLKTESLREISKISDVAGGTKYVAAYIRKIVNEAYLFVNMLESKNALKPLEILLQMLLIRPKDWRPILQETN